MALDQYALTTLESVKQHLRIADTSDDALLTDLINQVSAEIERICGIHFKSRTYRERYNPPRNRRLLLNEAPVQNVMRVAMGAGTAFTLTYSGSDIRADATITDAGVNLTTVNASGVASTTVITAASAQGLVTAIGATSGWSATLVANCPQTDLHRMCLGDCKGKTAYALYPDRSDLPFYVDLTAGIIEFRTDLYWLYNPRIDRLPIGQNFQTILVEYTAGYSTLPADVMLLTNRLVQDAYYDGMTARGITSASIGPFMWKAAPGAVEDIRTTLAAYLDPAKLIGGV